MVLSRADGTIIRCSGLSMKPETNPDFGRSVTGSEGGRAEFGGEGDDQAAYGSGDGSQKTAKDVAKMVFNFVAAAGGLVQGLDEGNEVQFLRLRTKKNEMVIVPGTLLR